MIHRESAKPDSMIGIRLERLGGASSPRFRRIYACLKGIVEHEYRLGGQKELVPVVRGGPKVGRNDPCPCGSGKKFKKCCAANDAPAGLH